MVKVRATRSLENALRRWGFHLDRRLRRGGPGLPGRPRRRRRRHPRPGPPHPGPLRLEDDDAAERERLYDVITREAARLGRGLGRRRAKSTASTSTAPRSRRCGGPSASLVAAARHGGGGRLPHPGSADGAARRRPRRTGRCSAVAAASIVAKVTRDREMAAAPRGRSALRLRPPQGLRDARSTWRPSRSTATRRCTADRSGPRPCLIRLSDRHDASFLPAPPSVGVDRESAVRKAEDLVREGKIDLAIDEYLRLVEEQPGDLGAANALGDLYAKVGNRALAVEQFVQIGDSQRDSGLRAQGRRVLQEGAQGRSRLANTRCRSWPRLPSGRSSTPTRRCT